LSADRSRVEVVCVVMTFLFAYTMPAIESYFLG
jgi:hypothetical protein